LRLGLRDSRRSRGQDRRVENESVPLQKRFILISIAIAALVLSLSARGILAAIQNDGPQAAQEARSIPQPEARVDINHASVDELLKVPGMTSSWAARIVRFRPYRTKAELVERGVLPSDVYDRIKDYVIAHRDRQ